MKVRARVVKEEDHNYPIGAIVIAEQKDWVPNGWFDAELAEDVYSPYYGCVVRAGNLGQYLDRDDFEIIEVIEE